MAQNGAFRHIGNKLYILKPRDYVVSINHTGVAGSTANGTIQIDPDAPFLIRRFYGADSTDPTTASPGLPAQYENLLQVQDNSNGYSWQNQPVNRSQVCGTREMPRILEDEILVNANTRFTVSCQEPTTAALGVFSFALCGYSLFEVPNNQ